MFLSHFDRLSVTKEELSLFDPSIKLRAGWLSVTIGFNFNVSLSKLDLSSFEESKTDGENLLISMKTLTLHIILYPREDSNLRHAV